ncbi:MAG: SH3 domain-containing protein [Scytonema sp. PMC 1069.18]|nr:SH3 domain-containing protein [Scytonema sp. PMC 1069.18]MEC4885152.1 SH3 domain-containing protein [Scytonema sp. PMC 1070.18]
MILNILKFVLGIFLAIAILVGGGVAVALYFMNRTSAPPTKPVFANDSPEVRGQAKKTEATEKNKKAAVQPKEKPKATPKPTPKPEETPKAEEEKKLPPGAYRARVTWSQGLIVRSQPQGDAERLGGVGFNSNVIVLQQSDDQAWQKIRIEGSEQEGWVKAGNTEKVNE